MSDDYDSYSGGCLSRIFRLVTLLLALALGAALYFIAKPQDMSDIGGRDENRNGAAVRDITAVLKNAYERGYPVTLTETELNRWLAKTLQLRQGGELKDKVEVRGFWIRLEDGRAELVLEREMFGRSFTTSMYVRVTQNEGPGGMLKEVHLEGGPFHPSAPKPPKGGRFGSLEVPQGFLVLTMPAYQKIAEAFSEEIRLGLEEMSVIRIEKDRLVLDPRLPATNQPGMPDTF